MKSNYVVYLIAAYLKDGTFDGFCGNKNTAFLFQTQDEAIQQKQRITLYYPEKRLQVVTGLLMIPSDDM